jgi:hypothetical protein
MARRNRFIPDGGALVEVTCRTLQSKFLLTPSRELNEIIVGILARAQRRHPVRVCGLTFLSSHFHLVLEVDGTEQLSRYMAGRPRTRGLESRQGDRETYRLAREDLGSALPGDRDHRAAGRTLRPESKFLATASQDESICPCLSRQ